MITVEKISGGWLVAAMVNGYRVKSRYSLLWIYQKTINRNV